MDTTKNQAIVLAVTEAGMPVAEVADRFGISTRWIRVLLARHRHEGLAGVDPRSRRPRASPNRTSSTAVQKILKLREDLQADGLDAGAQSIHHHLPAGARPSVTTIWRILKRHGVVAAQPQKRPRSSWRRFAAETPNQMWQSDFTHWPLADGTDAEIICWLDDHARFVLHLSAHARITGTTVIETFTAAADTYGLPATTLTDNGMVYTTRLAGGAGGTSGQPNGFEHLLADLGIVQKNGQPHHPTTQGKVERFHQTLKLRLDARVC